MTVIKALYDGWPLARQPSSPAALHLLTILAYLPEEVEAVVAMPEEAPEWLPSNARVHLHPVHDSELNRTRWEQRILPRITSELKTKLLHTTSPNAPFLSDVPVLVSPSGFGAEARKPRGLVARVRAAFGGGGYARATGIIWPDDLSVNRDPTRIFKLPPVVHPDFTPIPFGEQEAPTIPGIEMPDTYTLYHGPTSHAALQRLLRIWTWAAGPIGDYYPLHLIGLDSGARADAEKLIKEYDLGMTVRILPSITFPYIARLYQNCSALYHPTGSSVWGGPLRLAIACGRPVVAFENEVIDAITGPAAFLISPDDGRAFGAAMISVVIQESIFETLSEAAEKRSHAWRDHGFEEMLLDIYKKIVR